MLLPFVYVAHTVHAPVRTKTAALIKAVMFTLAWDETFISGRNVTLVSNHHKVVLVPAMAARTDTALALP